jgi:TetR/AcrR family transcriptional regulator, transcriptional repressor of aconitase
MPRISEARRSAQRRRILDAATACFERSGLDGASMQDIVAESGMSAGAIYRYFDGKAAIIEAVATERHTRERALLDAALDADPEDVGGAVRRFLSDWFDWVSEPGEARRRRVDLHVWANAQHDARLRAIVSEGLAPLGDVTRVLTEARARGALDPAVDPAAFARVLLALIQGFLLQRSWDPDLEAGPYRDTVLAVVDRVLAPAAGPSITGGRRRG